MMKKMMVVTMIFVTLFTTGVKLEKEEFRKNRINLYQKYYENDPYMSVVGYESLGNGRYAVKFIFEGFAENNKISNDRYDFYDYGDGHMQITDKVRHFVEFNETNKNMVFYDIYENNDEYAFTTWKMGWQY